MARVLFLAGAIAIGISLLGAAPRDVVLVYGLGDRPIASLEIEIASRGEIVRRAELRPGSGPAGSVRHPVRLPDGEYALRVRVAPEGAPPVRIEQAITVSESTTIVVPLEDR